MSKIDRDVMRDDARLMRRRLATALLLTNPIHTGEWQAMDTTASPAHATFEIEDVSLILDVPAGQLQWLNETMADQPWAEEHFQERVSGEPMNPAPSHIRWPYAVRGNSDHTSAQVVFSHTYPERYWPKFANIGQKRPNGRQVYVPHNGIRYQYGDLYDVVQLLIRSPMTRQAYMPVWFPEDTGSQDNVRVPCTLGYHFMIRRGVLSCRYYMRSCDIVRHWHNDMYLTGRLMQWVCAQYNEQVTAAGLLIPGQLRVYISSLHGFVGDVDKIREMARQTW
jgi:thymidylate synthase